MEKDAVSNLYILGLINMILRFATLYFGKFEDVYSLANFSGCGASLGENLRKEVLIGISTETYLGPSGLRLDVNCSSYLINQKCPEELIRCAWGQLSFGSFC